MSKVLILALGGIGDLCLSFSCGWHVQKKIGKENLDIVCCARPETYEVIEYLFKDDFNVRCHPLGEKIGENYDLITNPELLKEEKRFFDKTYVICPDLLYRANEYSFDWWNYNCHPQTLRQKRLLEHKWNPKKIIYVSLNTSTVGYNYHDPVNLIVELARALPDYEIYCPIINNWAQTEINWPILPKSIPENLTISYFSFIENLQVLEKSCYCVTLDCGILHLSSLLNMSYLLLDPRFGYTRQSNMWNVRWRPDGQYNSIDIHTPITELVKLVKTNIKTPETTLLPRNVILNNLDVNWSRELGYKFSDI